jgi:FMN phosphatase YigB (HAD superfamily)
MKDVKSVLNADRIKTVVFDLDGTLYDKRGLAQRMIGKLWWCLPLLAAERMARRNMHYLQFASEDEFYAAFFAIMARGHWWNAVIAVKWYKNIYMPVIERQIARHHPPRQTALQLIETCKKEGIKMAVFSDYSGVTEKLKALHVDPMQFDLLVDAPSLGSLKPSEPATRRVLELLDAKPEETLFVGDREEKDGAAAKAVGATFLDITKL